MARHHSKLLLLVVAAFVAFSANGQALNALGTLMRGKSVLDFHQSAIANPTQVMLLALEIRSLFASSQTKYDGLSNDLAEKLGWFGSGPAGLEYIELRPEPSAGHPAGHFSITLKKLKFRECQFLASHAGVNVNFVAVELNGERIAPRGAAVTANSLCRSQWFFQDGKNAIRYISR